MISPTCQYALRALVHLGRVADRGPTLARDIADAADVPRPFLAKILQRLVQERLVRSRKGRGGGFVLARAPGQITVDDVLVAVEGRRLAEKRCILGHPECNSLVACPLHEHWARVRDQFDTTVGSLTIRELAAYEPEGDDDPGRAR